MVVVELVAADADDAFEEGGAHEEQNQRDTHQPCPGADVPRAAGAGEPSAIMSAISKVRPGE